MLPEANPYAPPSVDVRAPPSAPGARPAFKLYSPRQICLAAFLGTPLAGMLFLAANRRRLGDASRARWTVFLGFAMTALIFATGRVLAPALGLMMAAANLSIWYYAHQDQGWFDAHLRAGGQKEPLWQVAVFGLAFLVAFALVSAGIL